MEMVPSIGKVSVENALKKLIEDSTIQCHKKGESTFYTSLNSFPVQHRYSKDEQPWLDTGINLVLDTIRLAKKQEKKRIAAELQLHSDHGFQYTSLAYFKLPQSCGITPSMSSKGNPYDNAMAENFFSILKTECIYRHKPNTFKEANDRIERCIHFHTMSASRIKREWRR